MYCVNGKLFADVYRNKVCGYHEWWMDELSQGFYFNADNIGAYIIDIRRQLIAEENSWDKSQTPKTYSNGETMRQVLARSKYTLIVGLWPCMELRSILKKRQRGQQP